MERSSAVNWVKAVAILNWISAFFGFFFGILFLFSSSYAAEIVTQIAMEEGVILDAQALIEAQMAITAFFIGFGILLVVLSILSVFIGFGLWRHRNWARILTLISLWLGVVWLVVDMTISLFDGLIAVLIHGVFFIIGMLISGFFLWLFHKEPNTVSLFVIPSPPPPPKAAKKKATKKRVASKK